MSNSFQIAKELPVFLHLLRSNPASVVTLKKVTNLLKPEFGEEGSNRRRFENAVYGHFLKYLRKVASEFEILNN